MTLSFLFYLILQLCVVQGCIPPPDKIKELGYTHEVLLKNTPLPTPPSQGFTPARNSQVDF